VWMRYRSAHRGAYPFHENIVLDRFRFESMCTLRHQTLNAMTAIARNDVQAARRKFRKMYRLVLQKRAATPAKHANQKVHDARTADSGCDSSKLLGHVDLPSAFELQFRCQPRFETREDLGRRGATLGSCVHRRNHLIRHADWTRFVLERID